MALGLGPLELLSWLQQRSRAIWGSPLKAASLEPVFALWGFVCGRGRRWSLRWSGRGFGEKNRPLPVVWGV